MATNQALVEAIYAILSGSGLISSGLGGQSYLVPGGKGLRISRPAAVDDQNVVTPIFTIAGGPIYLTGLMSIRTVIQAGGASNLQFAHATGPTNLHLATACTGDGVGTVSILAGDPGDALVIGAGTGVVNTFAALDPGRLVATSLQYGGEPFRVLGVGNITVIHTAAAGTGSSRYVMFWIPIDPLSTVVVV
jgi:hypothetical protein